MAHLTLYQWIIHLLPGNEMGVPKGVDNFKHHRASKIEGSLELLRKALKTIKKSKKRFTDISSVVYEISKLTDLHRTTLTRNSAYREEILKFLVGQPGASTFVIPDDATPELLRAKLLDAQLQISQLMAKQEKREKQERARAINESNSTPASQVAFSDTVSAFRAVLERINSPHTIFNVDLDRGEIIDLAADATHRVVVSGQRIKPFIEALRRLKEQER
jgi:hypothetical protein